LLAGVCQAVVLESTPRLVRDSALQPAHREKLLEAAFEEGLAVLDRGGFLELSREEAAKKSPMGAVRISDPLPAGWRPARSSRAVRLLGFGRLHLARGCYGGDEGGLVTIKNSKHLRERSDKGVCHLLPTHAPPGENEGRDASRLQGCAFDAMPPDSLVLGENHPAPDADRSQPIFVRSSGFKMVAVDLDLCSGRSQGCGDDLATEALIHEESEPFQPFPWGGGSSPRHLS
jgi:hypothetical protein